MQNGGKEKDNLAQQTKTGVGSTNGTEEQGKTISTTPSTVTTIPSPPNITSTTATTTTPTTTKTAVTLMEKPSRENAKKQKEPKEMMTSSPEVEEEKRARGEEGGEQQSKVGPPVTAAFSPVPAVPAGEQIRLKLFIIVIWERYASFVA